MGQVRFSYGRKAYLSLFSRNGNGTDICLTPDPSPCWPSATAGEGRRESERGEAEEGGVWESWGGPSAFSETAADEKARGCQTPSYGTTYYGQRPSSPQA